MRANASPITWGYFRICRRAPMGFARRHENSRRDPRARDSLRTKNPKAKFTKARTDAAKKGALGPSSPSSPPNAGPITKPDADAEPTSPKLLARDSGELTS